MLFLEKSPLVPLCQRGKVREAQRGIYIKWKFRVLITTIQKPELLRAATKATLPCGCLILIMTDAVYCRHKSSSRWQEQKKAGQLWPKIGRASCRERV